MKFEADERREKASTDQLTREQQSSVSANWVREHAQARRTGEIQHVRALIHPLAGGSSRILRLLQVVQRMRRSGLALGRQMAHQ